MSAVFSKLLLATERTEFDAGAETVALAMAQRCKQDIATVFPLASNAEYEALAPQAAALAERHAGELIAQWRALAEAVGVRVQLHLRRGPELYREIVDEAREQAAHVLVIRRRGKRGFLAKMLVGEMVSQVLEHAPCHVLVVPRDAQMWQHGVLVVAGKDALGTSVIRLAQQVAQECALPLHVCADPSAQAVLAAAQQHGADLIVVPRTRASPLGHGRTDAQTQQVLGSTTCAVLVVDVGQLSQ